MCHRPIFKGWEVFGETGELILCFMYTKNAAYKCDVKSKYFINNYLIKIIKT